MGCGKSKDAVATENTITMKKLKSVTSKVKDEEIKENNNNEEYYSPRKEDDINEIEEKSEYFSPHIGSEKRVTFFTNSDSVKLDEHSQEVLDDARKENGETPNIKEESMSKETTKGVALESSEVSGTGEDKMQKAQEEK